MTLANRSIPAILDTDIGGDIDDTWALAMMLRSPELDVKLVVSKKMESARCGWAGALDPKVQSSILFDTVAVYLAFSEELLVMEKLGVKVTDDGYTIIDDSARMINCATAWKDLPAFEDFLVRRLIGG
jgi:inosine-uridine nucleoside N-ribohydrolase